MIAVFILLFILFAISLLGRLSVVIMNVNCAMSAIKDFFCLKIDVILLSSNAQIDQKVVKQKKNESLYFRSLKYSRKENSTK